MKIEARGIRKEFRSGSHSLEALGGIDLGVEAGEFLCIVGPSGCGKSTFLRIAAGLDAADGGSLLFDGRPVSGTGPERIMVFQEGALFPWMDVQDNVEFGLRMAGLPRAERAEISARYLDMMQLSRFSRYYTYQLSTGMKQRVAIARALAMDPDVLLMDEPFAALDEGTRNLLLGEVQQIWARTAKTVLFVTHNVEEAAVLGTRIAVFGSRPSEVRAVVGNPLPRPRAAGDPGLGPVKAEISAALGGAP
ncbi:MAG: ABC transporter ATP-binding protein [Nitrosopumilus sp.]|nr:ABC transporter ATP-binding protein [Nitrosopumilus sp.]